MFRRARPFAFAWIVVSSLPFAGSAAAQPLLAVRAGFPNVPQVPGTLLSGLNAPQQGRTAILAYHNGLIFTVPEVPSSQPGSDFQVRTWDLTNPSAPVQLATWGITPMPVNAHGYFHSGEYLVLGANWPPEAPWSFRALANPGQIQRTTYPDLLCAGVRGCLFGRWFVGDTWWSYNTIGGLATLERNGVQLAEWDHLGLTGVVGHPFLIGDLLIFASDQSRTGVATYDVSDPANPVLLDVLTQGGPGGYWPELWSGDGKLYVVFPYQTPTNGMRVVDVTDPTDLRFVVDRALPGDETMYVQFQDEYAFLGSHKVDMRTFESVLDLDGANAVRPNDGGVGVNTSQFLLPIGNLLVTGGIGPNQGMAVWAHQAAPDTRGPAVGFHIPQAGRTNYPLGGPISVLIHETLETKTIVNGSTFLVRPVGGNPIAGNLVFSFDDILTFTPTQPLLPNTTYEVVFPAGGIRDAAGNGIVGYSFTFSTGGTVAGNHPPSVTSVTASAYPVSPGASVTLSATASDPDGNPLELRFDFGDGSPKTAWSSTTSANHSYAERGHYRASVQARDAAGSLATGTVIVTVLDPPAGVRPTASASVACDSAGRRVWTVNPDHDTVAAVHADALTTDLEVFACDDPRSLARSAQGEIWVSCHDDDTVRVLSATGTPLATLSTGYGSAPAGLVASPDGQTIYAALEGRGELARFNAATRQQTGALALGPRPRALAVSANGARVLVTRFLSPKDHAEVWDINAGTLTLTRTLIIPKFGNDENRDGTASGRGVANYLAGIAFDPDGQSAWVVGNKPNTERGTLIGPDLDSDNTVRNVLVQLDLVQNRFARAIDLDNSDSASALTFSPFGDYLLVTLQGDNEVMVLDRLLTDSVAGLGSFVSRLGTGFAPQGACVDPTTRRTFAQNLMGRSVTALETDALYRLGDKSVPGSQIDTTAGEPLAPMVFAGKRLFYNAGDPRMGPEGYLSCATCHLDGGDDGRVWDFTGRGEGLRRTIPLEGRAGMAHGNVHWSANFDEIQDFENDIRLAFGGNGFMSDGDFAATQAPLGAPKAGLSPDLDALAAYVASLDAARVPRSPFRNTDGTMTAAAEAGRTVFESQGCASCHAPPHFTDSPVGAGVLRNVGTLRTTSGGRLGGPLTGIDTPTLLGLWRHSAYFHDGSAPTLDDVFRVAGGEVIPAEDGAVSAGAQVVGQYVDLNNDDTVRGRAYVELQGVGERVTFNNVDGGSGGTGAIEVRYSNAGAQTLRLTVNGAERQVNLPSAGNDPTWRHTNWRTVRFEDVNLNAGATNTVAVWINANWPNITVDEIVVTTANELAAAQPHRRVLALSATDRNNLIAYLRQLDGRTVAELTTIFIDGFESGTTGAWSVVVP